MTIETETKPIQPEPATPTPVPASTPTPERPGFVKRFAIFLGRFLKALFKVLFVLIVIVAIGFITYLIVQELQRSFRVVNTRTDYNLEQVMAMRQEFDEFERTAVADSEAQDERLIALESYIDTTLSEDLNHQDEMLNALELQVGALLSQTQTMDGQIGSLNEGVVALQSDINENNGRIDELGGEIDTLGNNNDELAGQVTDLQTAVDDLPLEDIEQMRQVVTLFRVWEIVTRARIRLLENNPGLAANDAARALATVDALVADENTNPDLLPMLALVQARLTLADANLPDSPELAAFDLENAWIELDAALSFLLGIEELEFDTAVNPPAEEGEAADTTDEEGAIPTATPASGG